MEKSNKLSNHNLELSLLESKDGSHTLFRNDLNETYHSHNGAMAESVWVFIERGLKYLKEKKYTSISVLEIGFGTGLNAILAYQFAQKHQIRVEYTTLEPFIIPLNIAQKLNYTDFLEIDDETIFNKLHQLSWNEKHQISTHFILHKVDTTLEKYQPNLSSISEIQPIFDCIFYDAFAPNKQSEIWQLENLEKVLHLTNQNGVLVTYCAQGQFKRNLKTVGWVVESLQGAPPKREMVRATKL